MTTVALSKPAVILHGMLVSIPDGVISAKAKRAAREMGCDVFEVLDHPRGPSRDIFRWKPFTFKLPVCPFLHKAVWLLENQQYRLCLGTRIIGMQRRSMVIQPF